MTVQATDSATTKLRGSWLMSLAMFLFIVNDTLTKTLSTTVSIGEFVFLRGLFATSMVLVLLGWTRQLSHVRLAFDRYVIICALLEVMATGAFIAALFHMPLPNVTAIMQAVPITATLFSMVFLAERVSRKRLLIIMVGLIGVLFVVKPGTSQFNHAVGLATLSMVCVAVRDLMMRTIALQIPSSVVTLSTTSLGMVGGGIWALAEGITPLSAQSATTLIFAASFLIAGQWLSIQAVRTAGVSATVPFRYTSILWSLLLGFVVFGYIPDAYALFGTALIVGAGLYTIFQTVRER